ncbi:MAG: ParB N-terminal domain-containing protein [Acidobacteriota bacterium]
MEDARTINLEKISPNRRSVYDDESIEAMVRSIRAEGQMEPVRLWFSGSSFRLLDGEKRWRAMKMLGAAEIKAIIEGIGPESWND